MDRDLRDLNQTTQPVPVLRVFNNWDSVPLGWYAACESRRLRRGRALTLRLCDQQLVLFRGHDGQVRALDAFCPHMGLNLALGRVEDNELRCKFHGWKFNGKGTCTEIPCDEAVPRKAKLESYATEEQYGFVWVYPASTAPEPVFVPFALRGKKHAALALDVLDRKCHPHVPMVNGMDAQHVKAVHNIDLVPTAKTIWHAENCLEIYLGGSVPAHGLLGRLISWVLGGYYAYSNIFIDGTMAVLNTLKDVKLFGRYHMPEAYLIFSLKYSNRGKAEILPIAVTEKRPGPLGWLVTRTMLVLTKAGFDRLKSDEGEWFFENLRFRADALLPHFDRPIATLIQFINKQKLSKWSKDSKAAAALAAETPDDFYFMRPPPPPPPTAPARRFADIPPPPPPTEDSVAERTAIMSSSRVQAYIDALKELHVPEPKCAGPDVDAVGKELSATFDQLERELESKLDSLSTEVGATFAMISADLVTSEIAKPDAAARTIPADKMPEVDLEPTNVSPQDGIAGLTPDDFGAIRAQSPVAAALNEEAGLTLELDFEDEPAPLGPKGSNS